MVRVSEIDPEKLYQPGEVAGVFRVDPKTVVRWIKEGLFADEEWIRTPGGHHRVTGAGVLRYLGTKAKATGSAA